MRSDIRRYLAKDIETQDELKMKEDAGIPEEDNAKDRMSFLRARMKTARRRKEFHNEQKHREFMFKSNRTYKG